MMQTGFPDFIVYDKYDTWQDAYNITFIECKVNGYLSKEEKEKAKWYLMHGFCNQFLIAYKTKECNRVKINYKEVTL